MNMVIILVWLVVFMIIVLGIVFPITFLSSLKELYGKNQEVTVEMAKHYISGYFDDRKKVLSVSARMDSLKLAISVNRGDSAYRGVPPNEGGEIRSYLQKILDGEKTFRFFAVLTPDDVRPILLQPYSFQSELTKEQYLRGYAYREWAKSTKAVYQAWDKQGFPEPFVSNAFVSQPGMVPAVSISVPVIDGQKNMVGILYANMHLNTLCSYVQNLSFGKTGKVFLVDSTGHLLAHPDISPEIEKTASDGSSMTELRDFSGNPMVARALKGETGAGVYTIKESRRTVFATYRVIKSLGWVIVLEQDTQEAFSMIWVYAYVIVFLVIFSVIVSFVAFWYISRETAETTRQHNELVVISETDPLTGLLNRRSMMSRMGQLVSDFELRNQSFVIGLFDIDDFKKINDTYGHVYGDVVLREIAVRTVSILRTEDFLFRWGGEEFLVVLRNCDLVRGRGVAEKIRRIISDPPISDGKISVKITITIGLSQYLGRSIDAMVIHADEALYFGKRTGKNKVVVSED